MKTKTALIICILIVSLSLASCVSVTFYPKSTATATEHATEKTPPAPSLTSPVELARGIIEGRVYTNESAELTFTAPEGWRYLTDEEIIEIAGKGADVMGVSRSDLSDESFKKVNMYDMYVSDTETNTSVVVMYQDLSAAGAIFLDEETLLDLYKEMMGKNASIKFEFGDCTEAEIGSNTFKVISAACEDYGSTQYYYMRRSGNYMITVIATIFGGDDIGDVMDCFS